jgi:hypothetical protein
MGLKVSYPVREEGNTVPYPPLTNDLNRNHGFVDLRGRPDLVNAIPETKDSPALGLVLADLAAPSSQIMTLGCDLGEHLERRRPLKWRQFAGGYVQVVTLPPEAVDTNRLLGLCRVVESQLRHDVGPDHWEIEFSLGRTAFELDELVEAFTVWIWFFAADSSSEAARQGRERVLTSLRLGLEAATTALSTI